MDGSLRDRKANTSSQGGGYVFLIIPALTEDYQPTLLTTSHGSTVATATNPTDGGFTQNLSTADGRAAATNKRIPILPAIGRILAKTANGPLAFALKVVTSP